MRPRAFTDPNRLASRQAAAFEKSRNSVATWSPVGAKLHLVNDLELPSRKEVAAAFRQDGGRVAAVYPIHYPRGLFRAHGYLPIEVWGPPGVRTASGDGHVQAYACSIVRGGLSFLLDGGLDVVDLIVVPHSCDSLQGLGSLLQSFIKPKQPVLTIYNPRGGSTPAQVSFLAEELRQVSAKISAHTGERPSDETLMASIKREEAADAARLELMRARPRIALGEREFYTLLRSREFLPAEQFEGRAKSALATATSEAQSNRVPLMISGLVPEPMGILDVIEEGGGTIVADDLACSGRRFYPPGRSQDPFERMAERMLGAPPDSTRGSNTQERADHLVALAKESGASAVLFYIVKFCEPELFYLPQIRAVLDKAGLPSVVVEGDVCDELNNQATTRVQALLENLS